MLERIVAYKRESLKESKVRHPLKELKRKGSDLPPIRDFIKTLTINGIRIIAEIKKTSPSRGVIREDFDPVAIARTYEENGAAVISILTEERFFQGHLDYLKKVKEVTTLPLLRKDFIIDEYQVYESRVAGADAILLIAGILEKGLLKGLLDLSHDLGMVSLAEAHDERELEQVLDTGAKVIGINNRDLKTFETDLETTRRLIKYIPEDRVVVSESGINTYQDILSLQEVGVKAFLIGEALVREDDIGKKLKELRGVI